MGNQVRLLCLSDTQTELSNMDDAEVILGELLALAQKFRPHAIIHAGDLKEQYSPIHVPVAKFWVRATRKIVNAGFRFIINKGNHDRISQSLDSKDWLSILAAAGAEAVSTPKTKPVGDGMVAFLPYTSDKQQEREWADYLSKSCAPYHDAPRVLVFHTEVAGAMLNNTIKAHGNTAKELHFSDYSCCLGGHLHMHQQVGKNGYYIGSPFAHDWGEANQKKGFLLVRVGGTVEVEQVKSSIPGWYDTDYLESHGIQPENGAYIRAHVPVTTKKITQQLQDEEARLRRVHKSTGLQLFVIPKVEKAAAEEEYQLTGQTDLENVEQYVAKTHLEAAGYTAQRGVSYIAGVLKRCGWVARGSKLRYLALEATNVLCFKEVKLSYYRQGLVLIKGVNKDWPGHSNGAGKSSLLGLLPIAMFGETFKEQKNDEWANEHTEDTAYIKLTVRAVGAGVSYVERCRRPHSIALRAEDGDRSVGLTGKRKQETQGQIEETTGFDLKLLKNSVYIDQTVANAFVFGTQKDRMELVGRLLNFERFKEALSLVAADAKKSEKEKAEEEDKLERLDEDKSRLEADLNEEQEQVVTDWAQQYATATATVKRLKEFRSGLLQSQSKMGELQDKASDMASDLRELRTKLQDQRGQTAAYHRLVRRARELIAKKECPTCGAQIDKVFVAQVEQVEEQLQESQKAENALTSQETALLLKLEVINTRLSKYTNQVRESEVELEQAREIRAQAEQAAEEEKQRNKAIQKRAQSTREQLSITLRLIRATRLRLKDIDTDIELYEYARKALNRGGIPLYLASSMTPTLNAAADDFSRIFTEGKVQVLFEVEDGELTVEIVNPTGSKKAKGQSTGERGLAGIIAAFALRTAAPQTNLLILDEPGAGLDERSAKMFAKGLIKLRDMWPKVTILVTTHSNIISSQLEGEAKVWTVEKKDGISRLLT